MRLNKDLTYLGDILDSIQRIESYTVSVSKEDFLENLMMQDAVMRQIEIIGEASNSISEAFQEEHDHLPWSQMRAIRNKIVHDYRGINLQISSAGYRASVQLELLVLNFHVFEGNYQQWKNYVTSLKTPESFMKLWDHKSRWESNLTLAELTRLLLNFLGSATSLVTGTRNSVPLWYKDTYFIQEYEARKNKIKSTDEAKFVEGLRNYAQHDKLPFVRGQYSIDMVEKRVHMEFVLDRDVLLRGDWKKDKGRDFLSKGEKEVYIETIIDNYHKIILDFHQWIFSSVQEINQAEIRLTTVMQAELEKLLSEIYEL